MLVRTLTAISLGSISLGSISLGSISLGFVALVCVGCAMSPNDDILDGKACDSQYRCTVGYSCDRVHNVCRKAPASPAGGGGVSGVGGQGGTSAQMDAQASLGGGAGATH